ncbi:type II secretion system inner membrane protein GspF [Alkalilimnicola sp. S0819]|uniref:type II secretion system inner membrane protein GspF n=1 Tax=Alkalilimnicola sp. S0819 TaxID=2613922 RepID=UPI00126296A5|nr:type II secretion system inner membrane protein GspF [Alkalilimnicola sp. S0819]KAB7622993.1 type II secretion system protein GspF [Alkalilimnicola sp. S0819]MPQ17104.1 type II secretion system protein GspF [Alkalilimnicola sp. S0819]
MGAFEYKALDERGKERKGVLEGDTARQVRAQLREQGWIPLDVEGIAEQSSRGATRRRGLQRGASAKDVALLTRQLATLVGSGQPLEEALRAVAQQTEKPRLRSMMTAVRSRVMEGHTLADGMADFPRSFSELYRATVAAGEHTGHLDVVLERLADYTESRQVLRQKIQVALFYPMSLLLVATGVVIALLTWVVPKVTGVFDNIGQELPPLTVGLIAVSDFLRDYWLWLLLIIVAIVLAFALAMRRYPFRRRVHGLLLRVPLVGKLARGLNTGRFARTFSILTGSGVPVLEALRIAAQVISNIPMREAVEDAAVRVREGTGIAKSLERTGQLPPMTLHLIASGEGSGRLEQMLERAAVNQEREIEGMVASLLAVFEPVLILGMGGIVMVIVLAVLLPIFQLNQLVG